MVQVLNSHVLHPDLDFACLNPTFTRILGTWMRHFSHTKVMRDLVSVVRGNWG